MPLYDHLKLLKLDKIHDFEVNKFMHEMKARSPTEKKVVTSIKPKGIRLWNDQPTALIEGKLILGMKGFCQSCRKLILNLQQQPC